MKHSINFGMDEYWNGNGGQKWLSFQEFMDGFLMSFGRQAMNAAHIRQGDHVLDIGCGCGETSIDISRQVGSEGYVHGLDISGLLVDKAMANKALAEAKNITFHLGDAQKFNFDKALSDLVFSRFGMMFFDDPVAAFSNMRQALKVNGRLAFACWNSVKDNEWVRLSLDVVGRHLALPQPAEIGEPGPFSLADPQRIYRILDDAGFSHIEIEQFNTPVIIGSKVEETCHFLTQMGPAGSVISEAEADESIIANIFADLHEELMPHKTEKGVILNAAAWIVTARNSSPS